MYRKEEDKMYYTIGEVAKMFNLTPSTIRYYDKKVYFLLLNVNQEYVSFLMKISIC